MDILLHVWKEGPGVRDGILLLYKLTQLSTRREFYFELAPEMSNMLECMFSEHSQLNFT